ncbi:MAG: TSUP family transporter [Gaiellaceae bacterium]
MTVRRTATTTAPTREASAEAARPGLDRRLVGIGVAGGVLSGLLGVGGGVVMVPLLVVWAGYKQRAAHALSLGAIIPISLASVITYGAAGKVRVADAVALAVGAVVGARVGAVLLARIEERPLKLVFGLFLGAVAILMLVRG